MLDRARKPHVEKPFESIETTPPLGDMRQGTRCVVCAWSGLAKRHGGTEIGFDYGKFLALQEGPKHLNIPIFEFVRENDHFVVVSGCICVVVRPLYFVAGLPNLI